MGKSQRKAKEGTTTGLKQTERIDKAPNHKEPRPQEKSQSNTPTQQQQRSKNNSKKQTDLTENQGDDANPNRHNRTTKLNKIIKEVKEPRITEITKAISH